MFWLPCHFAPWKKLYTQGSKIYAFKVDPFSRGTWYAKTQNEVTEIDSLWKIGEILPSVSVSYMRIVLTTRCLR